MACSYSHGCFLNDVGAVSSSSCLRNGRKGPLQTYFVIFFTTKINAHYYHPTVTEHKKTQDREMATVQGQTKMPYKKQNKNSASFLSFPSSLSIAASPHLFLLYALSLWCISPKQIRDAEESLSHFSSPFPFSLYLSFLSSSLCYIAPLPSFSLFTWFAYLPDSFSPLRM